MKIRVLKSKIHRAQVTDAHLDYEGSISVDYTLLEAAGIVNYEKVHILNVTNGNRLETYAIPSNDKGHICVNGAAAHLVSPGDLIIIVSYCQIDVNQASSFIPKIICVDHNNNITRK